MGTGDELLSESQCSAAQRLAQNLGVKIDAARREALSLDALEFAQEEGDELGDILRAALQPAATWVSAAQLELLLYYLWETHIRPAHARKRNALAAAWGPPQAAAGAAGGGAPVVCTARPGGGPGVRGAHSPRRSYIVMVIQDSDKFQPPATAALLEDDEQRDELGRYVDRLTFLRHEDFETPCCIWCGPRHPAGYGVLHYRGASRGAHTVSWEWAYGPVPRRHVLHHACQRPACTNVQYLQALTHADHARLHGVLRRQERERAAGEQP
jgi:hypothetical protein